jgi:hypothetical protein
MSGRDCVEAVVAGPGAEHAELDFAIAHDVRVGRQPAGVAVEQVVDDPGAVVAHQVDDLKRNPEVAGHGAGVLDVLLPGTVAEHVVLVDPVLHVRAGDVMTLLLKQQRGDGAVDSAGHGDEDQASARLPCRGILCWQRSPATAAEHPSPASTSGPSPAHRPGLAESRRRRASSSWIADWAGASLPLLAPWDKRVRRCRSAPLRPRPRSMPTRRPTMWTRRGRWSLCWIRREHSWVEFGNNAGVCGRRFQRLGAGGRPGGLGAGAGEAQRPSGAGGCGARPRPCCGSRRSSSSSSPATAAGSSCRARRPTSCRTGRGTSTASLLRHRTGRNLFEFITHGTGAAQPDRHGRAWARRPGGAEDARCGWDDSSTSCAAISRSGRSCAAARRPSGCSPRGAKHVRLFRLREAGGDGREPSATSWTGARSAGGGWHGVWEAHLDRNLHGWYLLVYRQRPAVRPGPAGA